MFARGYMHPDKFFEFDATHLARCSRMQIDVLACGGGEEAAIHGRSRDARDAKADNGPGLPVRSVSFWCMR